MKNAIELLSELGQRLRNFGQNPETKAILQQATQANGWFTSEDILRAVNAIAHDMLQSTNLIQWLARYPVPVSKPKNVLVVMAGNIPLVGFFDLLCVLASGHKCRIKPSAKDTILIEYIIRLLHEIEPNTPLALYNEQDSIDAVIATGSDNANRYFRAKYAGIPSLLRGNRQSVAVLSGQETSEQLTGLADDIWAYSGLGCRSVSLLFLPDGYDLHLKMPQMNAKFVNDYRQQRAILKMSGQPYIDFGCAVGVEKQDFPLALSQLNFCHYQSINEVTAWLSEHDAELQCVVTESIPHSRRVAFGHAQSPALTDYPDDRDVLQFLVSLDV